jgi:hypothetical protein
MCESRRDPELATVFLAELDADRSSKAWRAPSDVDCNVPHRSAKHLNELPLGSRLLEVQATERAFDGPRQVVLDERASDARSGVAVGLEGLDEEPSRISEHGRFDKQYRGELGGGYLHRRAPPVRISSRRY